MPMTDLIAIRCTRHYAVPVQNRNEHGGGECGGCIAEDRDTAKEEIARLHKLVAEARCYIDPEKHVEWEAAAFAETEPCDRLFDENERLRALVAQQREECDEARARAIRWNNEHAAAEDRWVEERDALRAEVLQLRKNLLRTWAAAEVHEYDLRKLVAQQREALREILASGVGFDDPRLDCIEVQVARADWDRARAVLAAEVPGE